MRSVVTHLQLVHPPTLAVGSAVLAMLFVIAWRLPRSPGALRRPGPHAKIVRRSEPGTTFTWVALPLEGKWEPITDAAGGKPCKLRPLSSGAATGVLT
jgi:hypothetical protein